MAETKRLDGAGRVGRLKSSEVESAGWTRGVWPIRNIR